MQFRGGTRGAASVALVSAVLFGMAPSTVARAEHPGLFFNSAELDELRSRAADATDRGQGWDYASVFAEMRAEADAFLETPYSVTIDIPNATGVGSTAWSYGLSAALPPAHANNPTYPPWTRLSRDLEHRMEVLAFVYAITEDTKYLTNPAGTGALDMALLVSKWSQWTDPGYGCGILKTSCLDTGHLTLGVAFVYDVSYGAVPSLQRDSVRAALVSKGVTLLAAEVREVHRVGGALWNNIFALRVMAMTVGAAAVADEAGAQATPWLTLGHSSAKAVFEAQGADGGTLEGQLYGAYTIDSLVVAADVLARRGVGDSLLVHPWLQDLPRFASAFLDVDNRTLANFGDSSLKLEWGTTMFALVSSGNGTAQWYLQKTGLARPSDLHSFRWSRPELAALVPAGSGSALFQAVGHAALRSGFDGAPVVAMKSGPTSVKIYHNHFDHNSFIISAYGEWIAYDLGYQSSYNAAEKLYTAGSIGHNTLMVNKSVAANGTTASGGQVSLTGGSLDYFVDGAGYAKVVGQAAKTYAPGVLSRFGRRIFYGKPDVVWVFDDLAAPVASAYSPLLHTVPGGHFEPGPGPAELVALGSSARLQAFAASSVPWAMGYPKCVLHPGVTKYSPYAEWRTEPAPAARIVTALVPGPFLRRELGNPGFESGLKSWMPRSGEVTHHVDSVNPHSGTASASIELSASSGYFYSDPMAVSAGGGTVTAAAWVRTSPGATGTVSIQLFSMHDRAYLPVPDGTPTVIDASSASGWTELVLSPQGALQGANAVRLGLLYEGTGTVWFDDVTFHAADLPPEKPRARGFLLGEPASGLVVEGIFGVEAGASVLNAGVAQGELTTLPVVDGSDAPFGTLSSDAQIFTVGFTPEGGLKRAFLQGGTVLSTDDRTWARATTTASFDVGISRDGECTRLVLTEVATLEGPPYTVRAAPLEVYMSGVRVPFVAQGDDVRFPEGSDIGPGCPDPVPDGGSAADGAPDDTVASSTAATGGCACGVRSEGETRTRNAWPLGIVMLVLWRRRKRR